MTPTTRSFRLHVAALALVGAQALNAGCTMANPALQTEILSAIEPSSSCDYGLTNTPYTLGSYDPKVNDAQGYELTLLLRNNMQQMGDDLVAQGEVANINGRAHDLQVTSVQGCWFKADSVDSYGVETRGGELVDCATLPLQSGSLPVTTRIDEGSGLAYVTVQVLPLAALKQVFGAEFSPADIPAQGSYLYDDPSVNASVAGMTNNGAGLYAYSFASQSPANPTQRSRAWGANYPNHTDATVVVQLRANLQMQSGETSVSNWFSLPITVCPGCMADRCGPLVQKVCARGPCSDGTPCLSSGLCANVALTCAPATIFSGTRADFFGQAGTPPCLPAQNFRANFSDIACVPVGCNAIN